MENQNPQQPVPPPPPTTPPIQAVSTEIPVSNTPKQGRKFRLSTKSIFGIIIFLILSCILIAFFTFVVPQIFTVALPTQITKTTQAPKPTSIPTPDPTADWKIYKGSNYSFKYSPEWNSSTKSGAVFFSKKVREPQPTGPFESLPQETTVVFRVSKKAANETIENWAQNEVVRRGTPEFKPEVKTTSVAAIDAIETEFPSMHGERLTVFIKDEDVFILTLDYATPEDEAAQKDFKTQFASTLRFVD